MILSITITTQEQKADEFKALGIIECNWQLFDSDLKDIRSGVDRIKEIGLNIVSLHSPINGGIAPLIEHFSENEYQSKLLYVAEEIY